MNNNKVTGYLGNQLGFSETGTYVKDVLIKPRLEEIGIKVIDPFEECAKHLNMQKLEKLVYYQEVKDFWREFSDKVTPINNEGMGKSQVFVGVLDGSHAIDDGLSSEIGYWAALGLGPIYAIRSDFRLAENPTSHVNAQIMGYIKQTQGQLIVPPNALENWFAAIKEWYDSFVRTQV